MSPHEVPSSVSGRSAQIRSTSSAVAGRSATVVPEPGSRVEADAARPVGRAHLLLAEGLDLAEAHGGGGGADEDLVLAHLQLAGRERGVGGGHRPELEAFALVRGPGTRAG